MDIHVISAEKTINKKTILSVNNLLIKHNKITVLLGLNGSGKTTFALGLCGIEPFTKSNITYNGNKELTGTNQISMMLQNFYIFNDTVRNNIILPLKSIGYAEKEIEKRLSEYMEFFPLQQFLSKKATRLSGGEKTKVALIRAVIAESDVIILDEPTNHMDLEGIIETEKLLYYLKKKGKTILLISHNIYNINQIADEIILLEKGKVISDVTKENVKEKLICMIEKKRIKLKNKDEKYD